MIVLFYYFLFRDSIFVVNSQPNFVAGGGGGGGLKGNVGVRFSHAVNSRNYLPSPCFSLCVAESPKTLKLNILTKRHRELAARCNWSLSGSHATTSRYVGTCILTRATLLTLQYPQTASVPCFNASRPGLKWLALVANAKLHHHHHVQPEQRAVREPLCRNIQ